MINTYLQTLQRFTQSEEGWAMQDSNLRPSDYESVDPSNEINDLALSHREAHRQTATEKDRNGHHLATHLATRATRYEIPFSLLTEAGRFW